MKLYINVTTQEAIRHGLKEAGKLPIEVDLAVLDQVDRDILAEMAGSYNSPPTVSWRGTPDWAGVLIAIAEKRKERAKKKAEDDHAVAVAARLVAAGLPNPTPDDWDRVDGVLVRDMRDASPELAALIKRRREQDEADRLAKNIETALAIPDEELLGLMAYNYVPGTNIGWEALERLSPAVADRLAWRTAELARRAAAEAAAQAAQEKAEEDQIATWLAEYGSRNQRERAAAGMLPREEVLAVIEANAFAWAAQFPAFCPLEDGDVEHTEEYCEGVIHFKSDRAEYATDQEWDQMKALDTAAPAGTVIELRQHRGDCQRCDGVAYRTGIKVTVTAGALQFSREYAAAD